MAIRIAGTAFITGGVLGIGKAAVAIYARNRIEKIALVNINEDGLRSAAADLTVEFPYIRVEIYRADVSSEEQLFIALESVIKVFSRINIAVHAAGITHLPSRTMELSTKDWQKKLVIRQMLKQERTIVNVSSIFCITIPNIRVCAAAYVASKHDRVRINIIYPGYISDTPFIRLALAANILPFEIDRIAVRRAARVEEVAKAVLFLTSTMSSYVYSAALMVDGGYII
ncbi:hypothetical protein BJY04DRAFT_212090 [Aspergillus karnatakaensis]|uniref:SDR family NAD(P)-dependent oxidoreductase n=1 Tax=Aspergillus karnatakaensis TaxID=1810916 RepID=UPI003CCD05EB